MTTTITICDTCKREDWAKSGAATTDGASLASLIESESSQMPFKQWPQTEKGHFVSRPPVLDDDQK